MSLSRLHPASSAVGNLLGEINAKRAELSSGNDGVEQIPSTNVKPGFRDFRIDLASLSGAVFSTTPGQATGTLIDIPIAGVGFEFLRSGSHPYARLDVIVGGETYKSVAPGDQLRGQFDKIQLSLSTENLNLNPDVGGGSLKPMGANKLAGVCAVDGSIVVRVITRQDCAFIQGAIDTAFTAYECKKLPSTGETPPGTVADFTRVFSIRGVKKFSASVVLKGAGSVMPAVGIFSFLAYRWVSYGADTGLTHPDIFGWRRAPEYDLQYDAATINDPTSERCIQLKEFRDCLGEGDITWFDLNGFAVASGDADPAVWIVLEKLVAGGMDIYRNAGGM